MAINRVAIFEPHIGDDVEGVDLSDGVAERMADDHAAANGCLFPEREQ